MTNQNSLEFSVSLEGLGNAFRDLHNPWTFGNRIRGELDFGEHPITSSILAIEAYFVPIAAYSLELTYPIHTILSNL